MPVPQWTTRGLLDASVDVSVIQQQLLTVPPAHVDVLPVFSDPCCGGVGVSSDVDLAKVGFVDADDFVLGGAINTPTKLNEGLRAAIAYCQADQYSQWKEVRLPAGQFTFDADELDANGPIESLGCAWTHGRSVSIRGAGAALNTRLFVPSAFDGVVIRFSSTPYASNQRMLGAGLKNARAGLYDLSIEALEMSCAATAVWVNGALWWRMRGVRLMGFRGESFGTSPANKWRIGTGLVIEGEGGSYNPSYCLIEDCQILSNARNVRLANLNVTTFRKVYIFNSTPFGAVEARNAHVVFDGGDKEQGGGAGGVVEDPANSHRVGSANSFIVDTWQSPTFPVFTGTVDATDVNGHAKIDAIVGVTFTAEDLGSLVTLGNNPVDAVEVIEVQSANRILVNRGDVASAVGTGSMSIRGGRALCSLSAPSAGRVTVTLDTSSFNASHPATLMGRNLVIDDAGVADELNRGVFRVVDVGNLAAGSSAWTLIVEKKNGSAEAGLRCYLAQCNGGNDISLRGDHYTEGEGVAIVDVGPTTLRSTYVIEDTSALAYRQALYRTRSHYVQSSDRVLIHSQRNGLPGYETALVRGESVSATIIASRGDDIRLDRSVMSGVGWERTSIAGQGSAYNGRDQVFARTPYTVLRRAGLVAYWDLEHGVALSGLDITSLTDRLNGIVAAPLNAGQYPQYTASHAKLGGRPAAEFNTAGAGSKRSFVATIPASLVKDGYPLSLFLVYAIPATAATNHRHVILVGQSIASYQHQLAFYTVGGGAPVYCFHGTDNTFFTYGQNASQCSMGVAYSASDGHWAVSQEALVDDVSIGNDVAIFADAGKAKGSTTSYGRWKSQDVKVHFSALDVFGGEAYSLGALGVFQSSLTLGELKTLQASLQAHYGITSTNGIDY